MPSELGVGVIGLGFMGRTHIESYRGCADARLAGVFDLSADRLTGEAPADGNIGGTAPDRLFDPSEILATSDLDAFLASDAVEAVSICTPTDTHVEIAMKALRAGKHVLVEKPVSLDVGEIESLAAEAQATGRICMPAMCMRHWPAWRWALDRIQDRTLGSVRSAGFERLGTMPTWGAGFYGNPERSGGALFDLHIHDTDFVTACFGPPAAVTSAGDSMHLTSIYHLNNGPGHVIARGGWLRGAGFTFRMRYTIEFEGGTADFDLSREDPLRFSPAHRAESHVVNVGNQTGYDMEIAAFVDAVLGKGDDKALTLADAIRTTHVLNAERMSIESRSRVEIKY